MWGANVALGVVFPLLLVLLALEEEEEREREEEAVWNFFFLKELSWTGTLRVQQREAS